MARARDRREESGRVADERADSAAPQRGARKGLGRRLLGFLARVALLVIALVVLAVGLLAVVDPPTTPYMWSEGRRLGGVEQAWVPLAAVSPEVARAVVAAEDAGFCGHWGLDVGAIRAALAEGRGRGGSTISQQVAKNVFLWQGRSWGRKVLEAAITPVMEALLPKARILEIYLNVAEFGEGVFGVEAAARAAFGVGAADLTGDQAARLAAVLPDPKDRDAADLSPTLQSRAAAIRDGAATIAADGRAGCFAARD